ncbi:MAG: response regulator [Phycisphaerales bacterium]
MEKSEINILWVEDNIADILLLQEAFEMVEIKYRLHVVNDGVEAMDFLNHTGRFAKVVKPDLMILDLNLPRKPGQQVILEMKADPNFADIPLVILSGQPAGKTICQNLRPKFCIALAKPENYSQMQDLAKKINDFWKSLAV